MVVFERFAALHPEGRKLCFGYVQRAKAARDEYDGLMDLWIGFAGWMACITNADSDAAMVRYVRSSGRMAAAFEELRAADQEFNEAVEAFSRQWPVFKSQDVVRHYGADYPYQFQNRGLFQAALRDDPRVKRNPENWSPENEVTWSDFLSVVYQVRCNLVHGWKSLTRPSDAALVASSFELLGHYIDRTNCLTWD